jgi:uncharacterized SAM-binding protein YcdF (DUF218 family)
MRLFRWLKYLLCALGAITMVVVLTPVTGWMAHRMAGPMLAPGGDVLIVLGGGDSREGVLAYDSYLRTRYAIEAFRTGGFQHVLVTGGGDPSPAPEMRELMIAMGVPAAAIVVETRSHSTRENALFLKSTLDAMPGTKVLLTSDYHEYRAQRVFEKIGIETVRRPVPDGMKRGVSYSGRPSAFILELQESFKIVYYRVHGWI